MLAPRRVSDRQLWINPDCGLKTRKWQDVCAAFVDIVAARELRAAPRWCRPFCHAFVNEMYPLWGLAMSLRASQRSRDGNAGRR
ncbi:hypothetical protein ACFKHW_30225 [Bradyrhizobium lupini]|uniref:hypothetical protein n=1 Tax=Rhizobium lupini TaxID=136996 RepID=UPI00366FF2CF